MRSSQIKMLLCIFQFAVITTALYYYIFNQSIRPKEYYEMIAFIYGLILGFSELTVAILLFIVMRSQVQITSFNMLFRYVRENLFKEYYSLILINLVFLIASSIIGLCDENAFGFDNQESYHFISAFYIQCLLFIFFSRDLLRRRILLPNENIFEREGIFRCGYEVLYHAVSIFVIISYFLVVRFATYKPVAQCLSQLLIFTIVYLIYAPTRIGIIVKFFLFIINCRLIVLISSNMDENNNGNQYALLIIILILTILFQLRVVHQIIKGIWKARNVYYNQPENGPIDVLGALNLLPQRDPYLSRVLSEYALNDEEISQLQQVEYSGEPQQIKSCSVCGMSLLKQEIVIQLQCSHVFHSECLKPWLKMKNSCPNCRSLVLNRNQGGQLIQVEQHE